MADEEEEEGSGRERESIDRSNGNADDQLRGEHDMSGGGGECRNNEFTAYWDWGEKVHTHMVVLM